MKKSLFTLTELVLVVSTAGILGVFAVSAAGQAKGKAELTSCKNNLNVLAKAQAAYAQVHKYYFTGYAGFPCRGDRNMWPFFVLDRKIVRNPKVLSCPLTPPAGKTPLQYNDGYYGYGLLSWSCSPRLGFYHQSSPLEQIDPAKNLDKTGFSTRKGADNGLGDKTFSPAQTILFADSLQNEKAGQTQPYGIAPRREGYTYKFGLSHDGMCNTVMNDGHAEALDQDSLVDDYGVLSSQILLKEEE